MSRVLGDVWSDFEKILELAGRAYGGEEGIIEAAELHAYMVFVGTAEDGGTGMDEVGVNLDRSKEEGLGDGCPDFGDEGK